MSAVSNIQELKRSIRETADKAGRDPAGIGLVIVTKTVLPEKILEAYGAGERDFGENRVQEWQDKKETLPTDIRWHLIGHLQTNKVKYVVGKSTLIHSLDRLELADAIEKQAAGKGIAEVPCLVQVNMSGEESKFGLDPAQVESFMKQITGKSAIKIKGLMTIGPLTEDEARIRDCFRKTRQLFEDLSMRFREHHWEVLSMGMSADYKIAIEEGANMLRIGSLVFPRGAVK
ncbi:MAG TPA: YggS family pyridoxal phosphate-dependent enzyme [Candidatus Omnitrophota bacterium]|nr:YggS family pyridoxal phosphate-dependent enzyme [Candidatus Omnitrophota bacterium]